MALKDERLKPWTVEVQTCMNRKNLVTLLKLTVVISALVWLRRRVDFAGVGRVLAGANFWYLGAAVLLSWIPIFVSSFRWQTLLKTLGLTLPLKSLACVTHIGQFFAVLVPGVAGDDGTRFFYISRLAPGRVKQACSTVLLDRALGFTSLFILTAACIPLNWRLLSAQPSTRLVAFAFLGTGAFLLLMSLVFLNCKQTFLERSFSAVKTRFSSSAWVGELMDVASAFAGNRGRLCLVGFAALVTQMVICCAFCLAGHAVGIHLPVWAWMSFVPVILVAGVLPVTFAGIGVRDYLLFLFLGTAAGVGAGADQIAALSLLMLLFALLLAAIGGLVYLVYKPNKPAKHLAPAQV